jgi:hypothetical protein
MSMISSSSSSSRIGSGGLLAKLTVSAPGCLRIFL